MRAASSEQYDPSSIMNLSWSSGIPFCCSFDKSGKCLEKTFVVDSTVRVFGVNFKLIGSALGNRVGPPCVRGI